MLCIYFYNFLVEDWRVSSVCVGEGSEEPSWTWRAQGRIPSGHFCQGPQCWAGQGAPPFLRSWNHLGAPGQDLTLCQHRKSFSPLPETQGAGHFANTLAVGSRPPHHPRCDPRAWLGVSPPFSAGAPTPQMFWLRQGLIWVDLVFLGDY